MRKVTVWWAAAVALCLAGACNNSTLNGTPTDDGGTGPDLAVSGLFDVEPAALQTITVTTGQPIPMVMYTATLDGQPTSTTWSVDRGEIGTIPAGPLATESFVPRGTVGGLVTIRAAIPGQSLTRQIQVNIVGTQNGANTAIPSEAAQIPANVAALTAGGGVGGVGGEGLGGAVSDPATLAALAAPTTNASLTWLYPYNATVWPRGLLAPLLMWRWTTNDADAVKIELSTTSGSFKWSGTFARPAILASTPGVGFIRHPIPQDIWDIATNTAGGLTPDGRPEQLSIKLTIAKGGVGYGPISETWTVAPARLTGTIYYNSYGTLLAQNLGGAVGGNGKFGGAVLSIRVGDTGPKLLAGNSTLNTGCRTCHSVAANGSQLVAQNGDNYGQSKAYTITPTGVTETLMTNSATFPAIYPDGSLALSEFGQLIPLPSANMSLAGTGLATVASDLGTPAFSPSGNKVVFNPWTSGSITKPQQKLVVMDFLAATKTFSNPVVVVDDSAQPVNTRPGWPAFFPDGNSVIFHHQIAPGDDGNSAQMNTRKNARAEIAWTSAVDAKSVVALNQLNGKDATGTSYLPKLLTPVSLACTADASTVGGIDSDHGNDVQLNYEPTVNPVATGGYAWVVFTSRRMYGNEATIPPFCSDPRGVDLTKNITTKKLWVAAVDITGKVATDASHPAFYIPAQELVAGNSRGFWVLDPCKADGNSCLSGDQCCNGFCEPNSTDGALICGSTSPNSCSKVQEKCTTAANCCDSTNICVNGFCTQHTIG
jgi:hypothetical protein